MRGLDQVGHRLQGVNGQGRVVLDPAHRLEDIAVLQVNGLVKCVLQLGHGHLRLEAVLERLGLKGGIKGKGGKSVTAAEELQSRSSHLIPNILDQSLHLATRAKYVRDALVQLIVAVEACVRAGERRQTERDNYFIHAFPHSHAGHEARAMRGGSSPANWAYLLPRRSHREWRKRSTCTFGIRWTAGGTFGRSTWSADT